MFNPCSIRVSMKITFIQTGGTIDKDYPKTTKGWAFEISEPAVHRILEKLNPTFEYEVISLLKKDSLEITTEDRTLMRQKIEQLDASKVIITHGTDTMKETALFLSDIPNKTIILTGAMRPERFSNSDAAINIGVAIGAIQVLDAGVFIAMHGTIIPPNKLERHPSTGQFQST